MRRGLTGAALVCAAVLATACPAVTSTPPPAPVPAPGHDIWHDGPWMIDSSGRVVLFHGVNMVDKNAPYYPASEGFAAADIALIQSMGLNVVRLGVIFAGLMPQPGQVDKSYIAALKTQVGQLAAAHIAVILDYHQDMYSADYTGDGFPSWAVETNGAPDKEYGFPTNYLLNPAVNASFDSFWANAPVPGGPGTSWGSGLQNYYQEGLAAVASTFASDSDVIGYEIMNEPWPGSVYPACLGTLGCPSFDNGPFLTFIQRSITAIRSVDHDHLIFYEPNVLFNEGFVTDLGYVGDPGTVFAFHVYPFCSTNNNGEFPGQDQACGPQEEKCFANAQAQEMRSGAAEFLTEFGATSSNDDGVNRVMDEADAAEVGWTYWAFDGNVVPNIGQPPVGSNVHQNLVDDLARPYPESVAGVPTGWHYYPDLQLLSLSYSTTPVGGGHFSPSATTDISAPSLVYPNGYVVQVSGAKVVSAPNAPVLKLQAETGVSSVLVRVLPASG